MALATEAVLKTISLEAFLYCKIDNPVSAICCISKLNRALYG